MNQPTVSIIIPTYNRSKDLKRAVDSVRNQTFTDWELFIADDGSTDDTKEIINGLCSSDNRIHGLFQKNAGVARARNSAKALAHGKYVAFLDDDDFWVPIKLERQVAFLDENPSIVMVYAGLEALRADGQRAQLPLSRRRSFTDLLKWPNLLLPSAALVRKSALEKAGWFNEKAGIFEDFDLWLRIGKIGEIRQMDDYLVTLGVKNESNSTRDEIYNYQRGIRTLEIFPQELISDREQSLVKKNLGRLYYELARLCYDAGKYRDASASFCRALVRDPFVAFSVQKESESMPKSLVRFIKSYLAVPICLFKALLSKDGLSRKAKAVIS